MMKSARVLVPVAVLMSIFIMFSIVSCGGLETAGLEGTWTLTTTPGGGNPDVGDGTYTAHFSWYYEQANIEYYSGSGVINLVDYKISITRKFEIDNYGNDYYLFIYKEGENTDNSIKCSGILSGTSASGQYEGQGTYTSYGTGTFNTIKQ